MAPTGGRIALKAYKNLNEDDSKGAYLAGSSLSLLPCSQNVDWAGALSTNGSKFVGQGRRTHVQNPQVSAARWNSPAAFELFQDPSNQNIGQHTDINATGRSVFYAALAVGATTAYWCKEDELTAPIALSPGASYTYARVFGISSQNLVGGEVLNAIGGSDRVPAYWMFNGQTGSYGAAQTLVNWPSGRTGTVVDVGDDGWLVGFIDAGLFSFQQSQPFRYNVSSQTLQFIGEGNLTGMPTQVNAQGRIVGNGPHPWIWLDSAAPFNGAVIDLQAFMAPLQALDHQVTGISNQDGAQAPIFGGHKTGNVKAFVTEAVSEQGIAPWARYEASLLTIGGSQFRPDMGTLPGQQGGGSTGKPDADWVRYVGGPVPLGEPEPFTFNFQRTISQGLGNCDGIGVRVTTRTNLPVSRTEVLQLQNRGLEWVTVSQSTSVSRTFRTIEGYVLDDEEADQFLHGTPDRGGRLIARIFVSNEGIPASGWYFDVEQAVFFVDSLRP